MNSGDLETLRELNRNYVRAAAESDVRWFEANLAADFLNSNPDGTLVDRAAFLKQIAPPGAGRYTDVWQSRQGRWLCVSANVSRG